MGIPSWATQKIAGKRLVVRADLNVPMAEGQISSEARLNAVLPTVAALRAAGAAQILLLSHFGRPPSAAWCAEFSLAPVAAWFSKKLKRAVPLIKTYLSGVSSEAPVVVLENVRFNEGELENDPALGQRYAALGDLFVMEAFATAHRAQASTCAVIAYLPSCAGPLFLKEVEALQAVLQAPARPMVAIIGGSKISTKLPLLSRLSQVADQIIVGGGIANTLLAAQGVDVGDSLHEPQQLEEASALLRKITLPPLIDVVVTSGPGTEGQLKRVGEIGSQDRIVDFGPLTLDGIEALLLQAKTILWNGPIGQFEVAAFRAGTARVAKGVARASAFSVVGGGDTVAALELLGLSEKISYISTAGGAFLEFIEGKTLPAIAALEKGGLC